MENSPSTDDIRELRSLARMLRGAAADTDDQNYIGLFLCAAMALEARAAPIRLSAGS